MSRRKVLIMVVIIVATAALVGAAAWVPRPGQVRVIQPGCPGVVTGTSNALRDYAFVVRWRGVTYTAADGHADQKLGREVLTIRCSIGEIEQLGGGRAAQSGPWPDGTSAGLPRGTTVHALGRFSPSCRLAAKFDGHVVVFVANPEDAAEPGC